MIWGQLQIIALELPPKLPPEHGRCTRLSARKAPFRYLARQDANGPLHKYLHDLGRAKARQGKGFRLKGIFSSIPRLGIE
jgi:hypothetical protein